LNHEPTSTQSWHEFRGSAEHQRDSNLVLDIMERSKTPLTGREICDRGGKDGLWKRLSELEKAGMIEAKDKRKCTITGKTSKVWTLRVPVETPVAPLEEPSLFENPSADCMREAEVLQFGQHLPQNELS
jgi:hypothetical protein